MQFTGMTQLTYGELIMLDIMNTWQPWASSPRLTLFATNLFLVLLDNNIAGVDNIMRLIEQWRSAEGTDSFDTFISKKVKERIRQHHQRDSDQYCT